MLSEQGVSDVLVKMNGDSANSQSSKNKMSNLLFAQLDSISSQGDFASSRSKAAASLLLRISSKREIATEIAKNLDKLVKMICDIVVSSNSKNKKNNNYNNYNHNGIRFGILCEGLLSAIHNAVVLQVVQRSDLAKQIVAAGKTNNPRDHFLLQFFEAVSSNVESCVSTFASVVSKFFAVLAKALTSATPDSEAIAKMIASQDSTFFHQSSTQENELTQPMILRLAHASLGFVNQKRLEKAKKLADSENIADLEVVKKTADLWVGGTSNHNNNNNNQKNHQNNASSSSAQNVGIIQVNLLENISLLVAALFQVSAGQQPVVDFSKQPGLSIQLAKFAFELISEMSFCAPRVSGNAAMWITSKLAADPNVIKYWTTVDEKLSPTSSEIEGPKARAAKLIKILLSGVKNVSSLIYDAERNGKSEAASGSDEDQHQRAILLTTLKGARRNIAVAAAKLCAVEGGLFVEEFRLQGGTQLFGSLQIS